MDGSGLRASTPLHADLGDLEEGELMRAELELENVGEAESCVWVREGSCKRTRVRLPPSRSARLVALRDTTRFRGPTSLGLELAIVPCRP